MAQSTFGRKVDLKTQIMRKKQVLGERLRDERPKGMTLEEDIAEIRKMGAELDALYAELIALEKSQPDQVREGDFDWTEEENRG